jgi:hypothetical protein
LPGGQAEQQRVVDLQVGRKFVDARQRFGPDSAGRRAERRTHESGDDAAQDHDDEPDQGVVELALADSTERTLPTADMYRKPASNTKKAVAASDTGAPAVRSELKTLTIGPVSTDSTPRVWWRMAAAHGSHAQSRELPFRRCAGGVPKAIRVQAQRRDRAGNGFGTLWARRGGADPTSNPAQYGGGGAAPNARVVSG